MRFELRDALDTDSGFIAKSWVETLRGLLPHPASDRIEADEHAFRKHWYGEASKRIKDRKTLVAGPEHDQAGHDEVIYGWAWPGEFVYVRAVPNWRLKGLAKALLGDLTRAMVGAGRVALRSMVATHETGKVFLTKENASHV